MKHPNAATAGASTPLAVLVVWIAGRVGIALGAEEGVVIAGVLSTTALLIGRKGLRGIISAIWRGSSTPPPKT